MTIAALTIAPYLVEWTNAGRNLRAQRVNVADQLTPLRGGNFGVCQQDAALKRALPAVGYQRVRFGTGAGRRQTVGTVHTAQPVKWIVFGSTAIQRPDVIAIGRQIIRHLLSRLADLAAGARIVR